MSNTINPIAAEAARRQLTASQTEGADAYTVSVARAALDQAELRELESAQLYGGSQAPSSAAAPGRLRRWLRRRA